MQSLWPWHHSSLWIVNRGLGTNARGLFASKQGVISLSRQLDLMTCHKYIKRGYPLTWAFLTIRESIPLTFGFYSFCVFIEHLSKWFLLLMPLKPPMVSFTHHHEVCVIDHEGQVEQWRLTPTPQRAVYLSWLNVRGNYNTTSPKVKCFKVWPFSFFTMGALINFMYWSPQIYDGKFVLLCWVSCRLIVSFSWLEGPVSVYQNI